MGENICVFAEPPISAVNRGPISARSCLFLPKLIFKWIPRRNKRDVHHAVISLILFSLFKCLDFHQNKRLWRCNAAVSREWLSASLAGGKMFFLHSPTVSFTTPHLLWETEWGLFIIYGRIHDREICDGLFINLMNVWLFSFLSTTSLLFPQQWGIEAERP